MSVFDLEYADSVATFDFSRYVSRRALLSAKKWPGALVPLADIADAFEAEDEMAKGFRPGKVELEEAPTLSDWKVLDHRHRGQGVRLEGICWNHPRLRGRRFITTSHLVAMDLHKLRWARTLSRYYRLDRPEGSTP